MTDGLEEVQRRWRLVRNALSGHAYAVGEGNVCTCGAVLAEDLIDLPDWNGHLASVALSTLHQDGVLVEADAVKRTERGRVYQDGHPLPLEATRIIWETPWQPAILHTDQPEG